MLYLKSLLLLLLVSSNATASWFPDRRRDQFATENAYLVVPLPYSYPGIGEGFFLIANASNVFNTTTDLVIVEVTGDATGRVAQIDELPILENQLLVSLHMRDINGAIVNNYKIRGINGSNGNDYNLLKVSQADDNTLRLDYTSKQRRYNFYLSETQSEFTLDAILDKNGTEIQSFTPHYSSASTSQKAGFLADYTDDYLDPQTGARFGIEYIDSPPNDSNSPDFYSLNYSLSYYFPTRDNDTLVINYFQSDAHVKTIGNTDPNYIRAQLGLNCGADPACLEIEQNLVDSSIAAATYGTAEALGGLQRLRSYPQGRYQGGHSGFLGAEYRWNLTEETTPFNYLFWKDVRTGKQIAFFAEAGSVSEESVDLWDQQRYTYGVGFRLLTASGSVYRADIAAGDEGTEVAIFFFYPW
ncbi:MAG: hypothetical protein OEY36_00995 [Gammaproteobacteria bacterium]|nr:hypothetical protein [Gammaproteobacteria bacterium]